MSPCATLVPRSLTVQSGLLLQAESMSFVLTTAQGGTLQGSPQPTPMFSKQTEGKSEAMAHKAQRAAQPSVTALHREPCLLVSSCGSRWLSPVRVNR